MAVFYNREKSKIGTNTGSIIHWARQLTSAEPDDVNTKTLLPAGYLRCDGAIYSAEIFPELATILGVGSRCRYKKPNVTLLDNQFQVPDFGSKKIRASSGANLGDELDLRIFDDNDNEITKSGVGLDVQSNIGETYTIQYQGNFYVPSQQIEITGEPGFVRTTGNYTETTDILPNAIMPHGHFHDGTRSRTLNQNGNEYASVGKNYALRRSTLCVVPWYNNTRQVLCQLAATRQMLSTREQSRGPFGCALLLGLAPECTRYYFGGCFTGCNFNGNAYNCLIPEGTSCSFPLWSGDTFGCGNDNSGDAQQTSCGSIDYEGLLFSVCSTGNPDTQNGGFCCFDAPAQPYADTFVLPPNYTYNTVPFDALKSDDREGYSALQNVSTETENFGNDGSHRHFVNFSAEPHTYVVNTLPSFIPAAELTSTISIRVNEENKADQFVQPYLVQEFLIKF